MADFERRQFEIGLGLVRWSFAERTNFSEDSFEPKQVIQVKKLMGLPHPTLNLLGHLS